MVQAVRKNSETPTLGTQIVRRFREVALIILGTLALFLLLAIVTHHPADPGWTRAGSAAIIHNQGGVVGAWLADILLHLFGYLAYVFPLMLGALGWVLYRGGKGASQLDYFYLTTRGVGFVLTLLVGCGLLWVQMRGNAYLPQDAGASSVTSSVSSWCRYSAVLAGRC